MQGPTLQTHQSFLNLLSPPFQNAQVMRRRSWIYLSIQEKVVNSPACLNNFKGAFFLQTHDLWPCSPHGVARSTDMGMQSPGSCPPLWLQPASSSWTSHIVSLGLSFRIYKENRLSHKITKPPSPDIRQFCPPKEETSCSAIFHLL